VVTKHHFRWQDFEEKYSAAEFHIYGSSRLGILNEDLLITQINFVVDYSFITGEYSNIDSLIDSNYMVHYNYKKLVRGYKHYELSNHLGNVLVVISDKRITLCSSSVVSGYEADVISANDYAAFGAPLEGRTYSSPTYRYGFNGQEKDDDVAGSGNTNSAEFWEYDTRLGRRWNIDPILKPWESPYACFANNPIYCNDVLGLTGTKPTPPPDAPENPCDNTLYTYKDITFMYTEESGWGVKVRDVEIEAKKGEKPKSAPTPTPTTNAPPSAIKTPVPQLESKTSTPWIDFALKEKGQAEKSPGDNPRIIEYLNSAGIKSKTDETPWCAAFAHWCMNQSGIQGNGAYGPNWSTWGTSLDKPAYGCVAVFNSGHVGFVVGETTAGKLVLLHGNWSDRVDLSTYGIDRKDIKLYRYPNTFTPSYTSPKYR